MISTQMYLKARLLLKIIKLIKEINTSVQIENAIQSDYSEEEKTKTKKKREKVKYQILPRIWKI